MEEIDFTQNAEVIAQIEQIRSFCQGKRFSDVMDDEGLQYVDLVMEGGGVLGLALVGYTYALEQAGIRFRSTAGTSAGAINALLIQAMGAPNHPRSARMVAVVADMPMDSFQDGGWDGRVAVSGWLNGSFIKKLASVFLLDDLFFRQGINPGHEFLNWMSNVLKQHDVGNWQRLKAQMQQPVPGIAVHHDSDSDQDQNLQLIEPISPERWAPQLKIITAELSTTTKITLPEPDGALFYHAIEAADPAEFVRASMSVPLFFEPYRKTDIPKAAMADAWSERGYQGCVPDEAVFVDGGVISNFPISAFHTSNRMPRMPTFGIKLGVEREAPQKINSLMHFLGATVNIMRSDADEEFIRANPDYKHVVKAIPTGEHHWLNFKMSDAEKVDLFIRGVKAASEFLQTFDWAQYKETRRKLLDVT